MTALTCVHHCTACGEVHSAHLDAMLQERAGTTPWSSITAVMLWNVGTHCPRLQAPGKHHCPKQRLAVFRLSRMEMNG